MGSLPELFQEELEQGFEEEDLLLPGGGEDQDGEQKPEVEGPEEEVDDNGGILYDGLPKLPDEEDAIKEAMMEAGWKEDGECDQLELVVENLLPELDGAGGDGGPPEAADLAIIGGDGADPWAAWNEYFDGLIEEEYSVGPWIWYHPYTDEELMGVLLDDGEPAWEHSLWTWDDISLFN